MHQDRRDWPPAISGHRLQAGDNIAGAAPKLVEAIAKNLKVPLESKYMGTWEKAQAAARDGKAGAQGAQGLQGALGLQGLQGSAGAAGAKGDVGSAGVSGQTGTASDSASHYGTTLGLRVESAVNAQYWAPLDDYGLVGGFARATTISLLNVFPAMLVGINVVPSVSIWPLIGSQQTFEPPDQSDEKLISTS